MVPSAADIVPRHDEQLDVYDQVTDCDFPIRQLWLSVFRKHNKTFPWQESSSQQIHEKDSLMATVAMRIHIFPKTPYHNNTVRDTFTQYV